MEHKVDVTICSVSYNRVQHTKLWMKSMLATLNWRKFNYQWIHADNGSKDGTVEYLNKIYNQYGFIRIHFNVKNLGKAVAANEIFQEVETPYIVWTDSDIVVPHHWTENLLSIFNEYGPSVGLVAPLYEETGNNPVPRSLETMLSYKRDYMGEHYATIAGGFFMMTKAVLDKTGGYECHNLYGGIDGQFMHQVKMAGFLIGYTPRVIVEHLPSEFKDYEKWKFDIQVNLRKHGIMNYKVKKGFWD